MGRVKITCVQAGVTGESFTTDTQREWLTTPGNRLSPPKDVVIWDSPYGTCWNSDMKPVRAPVAVLEWKCQRKTGSKQNTDEDRSWLEAFSKESVGSTGYSVFLDLDAGGVLRELTVARCSGGKWNNSWLRRPL
jgi:hypothetical protein